jgi:hypothetical protein
VARHWHTERGIEEIVARCARPDLARAAYGVACQIYPKRLVMLCRSAEMLAGLRSKV